MHLPATLLRRLPTWGSVALALLLAACATPTELQAPLPGGPACCASLAELPYQTLGTPQPLKLTLDEHAPVFDFDGVRSRFAAFRLPAARPLVVDLTSLQLAGPGMWGRLFEASLKQAPSRVWAFNPAVLLLNERFERVRTVPLGSDALRCGLGDIALQIHFNVEETPAEVAYAIVTRGQGVSEIYRSATCAPMLVTHAAVARIELLVDTPEFGDGRIVEEVGARWYPGQRDIGFFSEFYASLADEVSAPGQLMLGERRLQYYEHGSAGLRRRLDIPIEGIASVSAGPNQLIIAAAGAAGAATQWHAFRLSQAGIGATLQARMTPDAIVERIQLAVQPWPVAIDFRTSGDKAALGRIGESANAGGIVTALPCGLCASGACGPELLAPCAAAYAVGATLGGAWALGKELVGALRGSAGAPSGSAVEQARRGAKAPVEAGVKGAFDHESLSACLMQLVAEQPERVWRHQGFTAALPGAAAAATGSRTMTVAVSGIALVSDGALPAALPAGERPARLVIDGTVVLSAQPGGAALSQALSWQSEALTLAAWGAADARTLRDTLDRACHALAREALQAGEALWRRH